MKDNFEFTDMTEKDSNELNELYKRIQAVYRQIRAMAAEIDRLHAILNDHDIDILTGKQKDAN